MILEEVIPWFERINNNMDDNSITFNLRTLIDTNEPCTEIVIGYTTALNYV
jgi:hypothetical protein